MQEETPQEFRDRMRSVGFISRQTRNSVVDTKDTKGNRVKVTTDELNNSVVERHDGQDVIIRSPHIKRSSQTIEVR